MEISINDLKELQQTFVGIAGYNLAEDCAIIYILYV